jgi:hypothetical protein
VAEPPYTFFACPGGSGFPEDEPGDTTTVARRVQEIINNALNTIKNGRDLVENRIGLNLLRDDPNNLPNPLFSAMKNIFLILFTICFFQAQAQTTQDTVKQVIDQLFKGMLEADSAKVVSVFHPSAVLQTISKDAGIRNDGFTSFGSSMKRLKPGQLDERITYGSILVDGNLASVWTPYNLYFDGKFMHCGANSFHLVRTNGAWKIVHLIDTRRKDCQN